MSSASRIRASSRPRFDPARVRLRTHYPGGANRVAGSRPQKGGLLESELISSQPWPAPGSIHGAQSAGTVLQIYRPECGERREFDLRTAARHGASPHLHAPDRGRAVQFREDSSYRRMAARIDPVERAGALPAAGGSETGTSRAGLLGAGVGGGQRLPSSRSREALKKGPVVV